MNTPNIETQRLHQTERKEQHWRRWGPYLSERQWGTVREDYSATGDAWQYFPHEHARSRAYRWGEDGLAGISDNHQRLCFSLAFWNVQDSILKERLFGVTGSQGNHAEDVKEYYFYQDNVPSHAYMKYGYKYPQSAFPYQQLVNENQSRNRREPEFELADTGIFAQNRYFDITVEYAKNTPEDILVRISVTNRGPLTHTIHVLPTLWFRNTWTWFKDAAKPSLTVRPDGTVVAEHPSLGTYYYYVSSGAEWLFTENETNNRRLFGSHNNSPYVKDGINNCVVYGHRDAVNPKNEGTKAAAWYKMSLEPGQTDVRYVRLSQQEQSTPWHNCDALFEQRIAEADQFYADLCPFPITDDWRQIQRQALAGMLWTKQFYHYSVHDWLKGDPTQPAPPAKRRRSRNQHWSHLYNDDILSLPDKWEYPWFAAWDTAFHTIALAMIDPGFAKRQLDVLTREWYMHPNGQIPAYEWNFSDVNPPVHAWATWRVYKMEQALWGKQDRAFLERVFQKLLLNFTWWVNQKDQDGSNIFEGGFLGLDNIGVFDRSSTLPTGGHLEQSDATSWMAMYSLNMFVMALELAKDNPTYEDIASKFFEHFLFIADALHRMGVDGLWDETDGFYYDCLHLPDGERFPLKVRSMVGLIPLFAVEILEPDVLAQFPGFESRFKWFLQNRPHIANRVLTAQTEEGTSDMRRLLSVVNPRRLQRVLQILLDEAEFLSPFGVRSLSKHHEQHPYVLEVEGQAYRVDYDPAESTTGMFGGNSNWRGPIWFPLNFLLIESLQKFHHFFGDEWQVECPIGSGQQKNLWQVSQDLSERLIAIFARDEQGSRPVYGHDERWQTDPHWRDQILFYEYFHGDTGFGLGASHQTGWTGLVAKLIQQWGKYTGRGQIPSQAKIQQELGLEEEAPED